MTTLLEIYNALSTGEDIDIEVIDEVKFKTDVVDELTEEKICICRGGHGH